MSSKNTLKLRAKIALTIFIFGLTEVILKETSKAPFWDVRWRSKNRLLEAKNYPKLLGCEFLNLLGFKAN